MEWVEETLVALTSDVLSGDRRDWDMDTLRQQVEHIFPMPENFAWEDVERQTDREEVVDHLMELAEAAYDHKEQELGHDLMRAFERWLMLQVIDRLWIQHLTAIDDLREGIGLRAYGQRDPLIEYKVEAARMFDDLQAAIRSEVVARIYNLPVQKGPPPPPPPSPRQAIEIGPDKGEDSATPSGNGSPRRAAGARPANGAARQPVHAVAKVGRNDPCPCGSGKKYKRCHGA
jgi:preprotein translocase subunit SecA